LDRTWIRILITGAIIAGSIILFYIIQYVIYRKYGLRNLAYDRWTEGTDPFEGDEIHLVEKVENNKLLPLPYLQVDSVVDPGLKFDRHVKIDIRYDQYLKSMFNLLPYMRITRKHRIMCQKRGIYDFDMATVCAGDLFGFETAKENRKVKCGITVFPRLVNIERIPFPSHNYIGNFAVKRWIVEDPFIISGVREYRYGDPLNRVNWNATARTGSLQVHKKDYSADPGFMIYLNYELDENMWDYVTDMQAIETGISYSASIAQYAVENGIRAGFACNGGKKGNTREWIRFEAEAGNVHLYKMLEGMSGLSSRLALSFGSLLKEDVESGMTGMDIIIITAYLGKNAEEQIENLKSMGNAVEVVWLQPGKAGDVL